MKKLVVFMVVTVIIAVFVCPVTNSFALALKNEFSYLLFGFDNAGENSDVILLVTYKSEQNEIAVIQIPRDTYFEHDGGNKINSVYSKLRLKGDSPDEALKKASDIIANAFSLKIDGYAGVTTGTFRRFVDSFGGVRVNLPEDFDYVGDDGVKKTLSRGEHLLDGKMAEFYVRHRKSYAMGDLGRVDAQKIFINGIYNSIVKDKRYDDLFKAIASLKKDIITDFSLSDVAAMVFTHSPRAKDAEIFYVTLPGTPIKTEEGRWYYVINNKASFEVMKRYGLFKKNDFDTKRIFSDETDSRMKKIYNSDNFDFREYNEKNIYEIDIPKS